MWKALNVEDYPLKIKQQIRNENGVTTRASEKGRPINIGKTNITQNTSTSDAIRIWNICPDIIKDSKTVYQAKSKIQAFVKTLPIQSLTNNLIIKICDVGMKIAKK